MKFARKISSFHAGSVASGISVLVLFSNPFPLHAQSAASGTIVTVAGTGLAGPPGDGGPATNARLTGPVSLAVSRDGTLYFYDLRDAESIGNFRTVNPTNGIIDTIVADASFNVEIALDRGRHKLYFGDFDDDLVNEINLADNAVNLFAGVGWSYPFAIDGSGNRGDGGPADQAWFSSTPAAVCVDGAGNVFIAEPSRIRKVDAISGIINSVFGRADPCCGGLSDIAEEGGDGGLATDATGSITRMAVDRAGDIFILDNLWDPNTESLVSHIRRVDVASGLIDTIAGAGIHSPDDAGLAAGKGLTNLQAIAVNDAGTDLFLGGLQRVYRVDLTTGILSPYAGNGTNGFAGDGGPALESEFNENGVHCLAVAPGGGLIISDYGNLRIRYVAPDSITLTNDPGQTEFHLPWVGSLEGDLIITGNTNLTVVDTGSLTNVAGCVVIDASSNAMDGTLDLGSLTKVNGSVTITNSATSELDLGSLTTVGGSVVIDASSNSVDLGSLTIVEGSVAVYDAGNGQIGGVLDLGSLTTSGGSVTITNSGTEVVSAGSLTSVSGSVDISGNTSTTNIDLGSLTNVCGDITIVSNAPDATVEMNSLTDVGGCDTNAVTMTVDGNLMATNGMTIETNATLAGSATVDGSVTNNGTLSPGASPGQLAFKRDLLLRPSSRLKMEIAGYDANQFDSIAVAGGVQLGGTLAVTLLDDFPEVMANGDSFTILTAGSPLTGAFGNVPSGGTLTTTDGRAQFTVVYAGETSVRLTNLLIIDRDGDGATDEAELAAGTDPRNVASVLRITSVQREAGGVRITWSTVGGKSYLIQTNNGLGQAFGDFGPVIAIPGNGESTTNALAGDGAGVVNRFYRVRLAP